MSNEFYSTMEVSKYEMETEPAFEPYLKKRLASGLLDFIINKSEIQEFDHPSSDLSTYKMRVTILSPKEYDDIQKELYRLRYIEEQYYKKIADEILGGNPNDQTTRSFKS